MRQKLLLVIIIILVIVVVGVYFVVREYNKADWQTFKNRTYGFEMKYPSYLSDAPIAAPDTEFKSSVNDYFSVQVLPGSLDGVIYNNQGSGGTESFKYYSESKKWVFYQPGYTSAQLEALGNQPEIIQLMPEEYLTKNGLLSYIFKTGEICWEGEKVYIESPDKAFVIALTTNRPVGPECFVSESEPPFSTDRTIYAILDSLKFQ